MWGKTLFHNTETKKLKKRQIEKSTLERKGKTEKNAFDSTFVLSGVKDVKDGVSKNRNSKPQHFNQHVVFKQHFAQEDIADLTVGILSVKK